MKSRQDVLVQLKSSPGQLVNVSETKPYKEQVKSAIELASSLRNGNNGCENQMVSSDEVVPMEADNEVARNQSGELCRQGNELDADSDMVFQNEETESGEQEISKAKDPRIYSFTSAPQQFSNNSGNVVQPCSVQVSGGAPDTTLSRSSNVAAIDSTSKAEEKEETGLQLSHKVTFQIVFFFFADILQSTSTATFLAFFTFLRHSYPKAIELMICFW